MTLTTDEILVVGFKNIIRTRNRARVTTSNIVAGQFGIPDLADIVADYIFGVKKFVPPELADSVMMTDESMGFTYSISSSNIKIYIDFYDLDDSENTILVLHTWLPQRLSLIINWGDILDILTTGYSEHVAACLSQIRDHIGHEIDPADFMNSYYDFFAVNLDCL